MYSYSLDFWLSSSCLFTVYSSLTLDSPLKSPVCLLIKSKSSASYPNLSYFPTPSLASIGIVRYLFRPNILCASVYGIIDFYKSKSVSDLESLYDCCDFYSLILRAWGAGLESLEEARGPIEGEPPEGLLAWPVLSFWLNRIYWLKENSLWYLPNLLIFLFGLKLASLWPSGFNLLLSVHEFRSSFEFFDLWEYCGWELLLFELFPWLPFEAAPSRFYEGN